jgi:hypothetical protein
MSREQLLALLRQRFVAVGHGITFDVIEDGVRQDGDWWYVPVLATRNGRDVPRELAVNVFANVEDEFEQQHNVSVLFVPAVDEQVGQP